MNWPGHLVTGQGDPAELFGVHTTQALANFDVRGPSLRDYPQLVRAVAMVKIAAARANVRVGALSPDVAGAIVAAAREIGSGAHDDQFVLPILQGGGGTSTNMTVNEVIARRAEQLLRARGSDLPVHPNDHVNRGQSTNDVMPTAIALAVCEAAGPTIAALGHLVTALQDKAVQYRSLERLGRTCLQDAIALPAGALHETHAHGIERAVLALGRSVEVLLAVPLGGTAVGTGVGAAPGFAEIAIAELALLSGRPVIAADNPCFAMASLEPLVAVSESVDRCARAAARVATDLRLLASGPVGGIGEIELPAVQAGSSIMPGKVNPVIPELVMQIAFQIAGEATSARLAAGAGELEVSAMAPVVTLGLLAGLDRLGSAARLFADRCVAGLRWNEAAVAANLAGSLTQAVTAAATEGYDTVAGYGRTGAAMNGGEPS